MKKFSVLALLIAVLLICSCTDTKEAEEVLSENVVKPDFVKEELDEKFGTNDIYIVKTYMETPTEEIQEYLDENKIFTKVKHYQLSDGSWKTDDYSYKYKLEISGVMNNAACGTTYHILSNNDDITFDMAWKASGLSSNTEDYFKPEDAIIVGVGKFDIDNN